MPGINWENSVLGSELVLIPASYIYGYIDHAFASHIAHVGVHLSSMRTHISLMCELYVDWILWIYTNLSSIHRPRDMYCNLDWLTENICILCVVGLHTYARTHTHAYTHSHAIKSELCWNFPGKKVERSQDAIGKSLMGLQTTKPSVSMVRDNSYDVNIYIKKKP